jgi:DNA repair protein RecN (Recombination protein N)
MLSHLTIRNFALIESAEIDLPRGYSAITGETGSGKSILLGALNLILGERADYSVIRDPEKKTVVEAVFMVSGGLQKWFEQEDIDWSEETVVRREISAQGKSRAFINDTPVQLTQLKELTGQLIYIHSQHQTIELKDPVFQLNLLDSWVENGAQAEEYASLYDSWTKNTRKLRELHARIAENLQEHDFIKFQLEEITALDLPKNDYSAFESELKRADRLDDLKTAYSALSAGLQEDDGILGKLRMVQQTASKMKQADPMIDELTQRLASAIIELDDISDEAQRQLESLEADPERHQFLLQAVDRFNTVLRKHNLQSQDELSSLEREMESRLVSSDEMEHTIADLEERVKLDHGKMSVIAEELHVSRQKAGVSLRKHLLSLLSDLKLQDTDLEFAVEKLENPDKHGMSRVQLKFSANKGLELKAIDRTASGGELSRLMLAVQHTLSKKKSLPTLILDEIDTGVSGEVALRIGQLLQKMGDNMQLLAITHLPQVAAKGQHQFEVSKSSDGSVTNSKITLLDETQRRESIARLMSGDKLSGASLENAGILLGQI